MLLGAWRSLCWPWAPHSLCRYGPSLNWLFMKSQVTWWQLERTSVLTNYLPVEALGGCLLALWHPPLFLWFKKDYVTGGLALTMLAMGTTLTLQVRYIGARASCSSARCVCAACRLVNFSASPCHGEASDYGKHAYVSLCSN